VLLVEDDEGDLVMAREAIAEGGSTTVLHTVRDGVEALAFLRKETPHAKAPAPDLVILDLNLPGLSGHELLATIKVAPEWRAIPVVVLSTSRSEKDIRRAYELQASAFLTKPSSFDGFAGVVREIERFFGDVAELPAR
jgi:two-component system response regulator